MKDIIVLSRTVPDGPEVYGDSVTIHEGDNNMLGHWDGSACPNGRYYNKQTGQWLRYQELYGWMAPGDYSGKVINHERKYGKSILLADGGKLPARYPNPNRRSSYFGTPFVAEIFIHKGFSVTCRGSAACITIHPQQWASFIDHFVLGELVTVRLRDMLRSTGR